MHADLHIDGICVNEGTYPITGDTVVALGGLQLSLQPQEVVVPSPAPTSPSVTPPTPRQPTRKRSRVDDGPFVLEKPAKVTKVSPLLTTTRRAKSLIRALLAPMLRQLLSAALLFHRCHTGGKSQKAEGPENNLRDLENWCVDHHTLLTF